MPHGTPPRRPRQGAAQGRPAPPFPCPEADLSSGGLNKEAPRPAIMKAPAAKPPLPKWRHCQRKMPSRPSARFPSTPLPFGNTPLFADGPFMGAPAFPCLRTGPFATRRQGAARPPFPHPWAGISRNAPPPYRYAAFPVPAGRVSTQGPLLYGAQPFAATPGRAAPPGPPGVAPTLSIQNTNLFSQGRLRPAPKILFCFA